MTTASRLLGAAVHRQKKFGRWAVLAVATLLGILTIGPRLESVLFPVLYDYRPINMSIDTDGGLVFQAVYNKGRDCEFVSRTWYGVDADGVQERSVYALSIYPTGEGPETRPLGLNRAVKMKVLLPPGSKQMVGVFRYNCPLTPWQSRVQVGPFDTWNVPSASGKSP